MKKTARLTALDSFMCLASDCQENCCAMNTWAIPVEDEIFARWQTIPDDQVRNELVTHVRYLNVGDMTVRSLAPSGEKRCAHLDRSNRFRGWNA